MEKVLKIQSANSIIQSFRGDGSTAPSHELLDFKIPNIGEVYDLSKSYISINVNLTHDTAAIGGFAGAHKLAMGVLTDTAGFATHSHVGDNTLLVKNLQFYSQSRGMVESVRKLDTLNLAKRYLEKDDIELQRDLDMLGFVPQKRGTNVFTTAHVDEVRVANDVGNSGTGINASKADDRDQRIYLKDIMGIGKAPLFDSQKYGDCDLHLELNLNKLRTICLSGSEGTNEAGTASFLAMANQSPADGTAVFEFITSATYKDFELECPFFVGQFVTVQGTWSGGANPNINCVIKAIVQNADKTLTITVNLTVVTMTAAGQTLNGITITPFSNPVVTININEANLTLVAVKNPPSTPDTIDYITYTTEEIDGGNSSTTINKMAKIEPNCQTLYIAHCDANQIAPRREIQSYRMSINNIDVSGNREIKRDSGLYKDRRIRAYRNKNVPLKNLSDRLMNNDVDQGTFRADTLACLVEPMELTQSEKTMQLKLVTSANAQDVILFKEVIRTI